MDDLLNEMAEEQLAKKRRDKFITRVDSISFHVVYISVALALTGFACYCIWINHH